MTNNFNGFNVIRNVISEDTVKLLATQIRLIREIDILHNNIQRERDPYFRNDSLVEKAWGMYAIHCFESLCQNLIPKVSEIVGKELLPTYTYARIYLNGAAMRSHRDRPSCEYSTTMCIEPDPNCAWPIWIKDYSGNDHEVILNAGDMLVYRGTELFHWREQFGGEEHIQAFLHYVDANGDYPECKWDSRPLMGLPEEAQIPGILDGAHAKHMEIMKAKGLL